MPSIEPGELTEFSPFLLVEGGWRYCIGWQKRPARRGGDFFALLRRTRLDDIKVLERFPLTENGWTQTWRALVRADPQSAERALTKLADRVAVSRARAEIAELDARSLGYVRSAVFLGGYAPGITLAVAKSYDLRFLEDRLIILPCRLVDVLDEVLYGDIVTVDIGGPGLVKKWSPAQLASLALAFGDVAVLIASSQTKIKTILRVQTADREIFFLDSAADPDAMRIRLSRALRAVRDARAAHAVTGHEQRSGSRSLLDQLGRLASMLDAGLLTREEFDRLKAELIRES